MDRGYDPFCMDNYEELRLEEADKCDFDNDYPCSDKTDCLSCDHYADLLSKIIP